MTIHVSTAEGSNVLPDVVAPARRRLDPTLRPVPAAPDFEDIVDEWGEQSFPASDPPANW